VLNSSVSRAKAVQSADYEGEEGEQEEQEQEQEAAVAVAVAVVVAEAGPAVLASAGGERAEIKGGPLKAALRVSVESPAGALSPVAALDVFPALSR
jgi:hypothetical protein